MTGPIRVLILVLIPVLLAAPHVHADSSPVPVGVYPVDTRVTYYPSVSNHQVDCSWGFFCRRSLPAFHVHTQDQLHRLHGWAQVATTRAGAQILTFELFVSYYFSGANHRLPWSTAAYTDFIAATRFHGYVYLPHPPQILPGGADSVLVGIGQQGPRQVVIMAAWTGAVELESVGMMTIASPRARQAVIRSLTYQAQAALREITCSPPSRPCDQRDVGPPPSRR